MTRSEIVEAVREDLEARDQWDHRQSMFYDMRHHGLRRTQKPWPNASDVHFPLCDSIIERLKPVYFQQLFTSDLIARFVPDSSGMQTQEMTNAAALWYDYQVRHSTEFELEVLRAIDMVLLAGRSAVKVGWDADAQRIQFTAVPAQLLIVPYWTTKIEDADRITHVLRFSPEAYRRAGLFRDSEEYMKRIIGSGDTTDSAEQETRQNRYMREGLTHTDDDSIILWEIWTRDERGTWGFETLSPLVPEEPARARVTNPYRHGKPPFCPFVYEEKEAGWYSSRGLVEILATFEAELNKLWNEKNDAMTLFNRPLFRTERDLGSAQNLRWVPGQILPMGVQPVQMPSPPVSWDTQTILVRDIANNLVNVPSFPTAKLTSEPKTATEIDAMTASSTQSADLRLRVFRRNLANLHRMTWSVLQQYNGSDLIIWVEDRLQQVPEAAIRGEYRIEPSGSADGLTRQQTHAKSIARLQLFTGSPFVNQAELTKTVLESDDAGLVKRLYVDPGQTAADQVEQQGQEIAVMMLGIPASVSPSDDHKVHLGVLLEFALRMARMSGQSSPEAFQMFLPHASEHLKALAQTEPQEARAFGAAFGQIAHVAGNGQPPGGNGQPPAGALPGAPAPPAGQPMGEAQMAERVPA